MATRIYALAPGLTYTNVQENIGPTATSAAIAIVVDLATTVVSDGATTRTVRKQEVLDAIETLRQYILTDGWPPA